MKSINYLLLFFFISFISIRAADDMVRIYLPAGQKISKFLELVRKSTVKKDEQKYKLDKKSRLKSRFALLARSIQMIYKSERFNQAILESLFLRLVVLLEEAKNFYPKLVTDIDSFVSNMDELNKRTIEELELDSEDINQELNGTSVDLSELINDPKVIQYINEKEQDSIYDLIREIAAYEN